jgi:hypothetical protein
MIDPFHLLHRSKGRSGALLLHRTTGLPSVGVTHVTLRDASQRHA